MIAGSSTWSKILGRPLQLRHQRLIPGTGRVGVNMGATMIVRAATTSAGSTTVIAGEEGNPKTCSMEAVLIRRGIWDARNICKRTTCPNGVLPLTKKAVSN